MSGFEVYPREVDGVPGQTVARVLYGWRFRNDEGDISVSGMASFPTRKSAHQAIEGFVAEVYDIGTAAYRQNTPRPEIVDVDIE